MKECKRSCLFYIMEGGLLQVEGRCPSLYSVLVQIFPSLVASRNYEEKMEGNVDVVIHDCSRSHWLRR